MANVGDKLKSSQPDIIDMFNDVDDRFENLMNRIGNNIDRVIAMID
jgi:hypothetical protein